MTQRRSLPATLRHGAVEASLSPDHGAALLSVKIAGDDMLRPAPSIEAVAEDPRNAACFPCVPWFGRLFDGVEAGGRKVDLAPTLPACDPRYPLHGEGWTRSWGVASYTDDFIECRFASDGEGEGRFPFPYEARQIAQIVGGAFELDLSVRNIGRSPMPAGLGLHPYFPRGADTVLDFEAESVWLPAQAGGGESKALSPGLDFARGAPLPADNADFSFMGFSGRAEVRSGGKRVRLETDAPILHLFAPAGAGFFCLEPVSHRPGIFGEDMLAPGETSRLKLTISAPL